MTRLIRGAERILTVFGYWPSFHDAEVIRLILDRAPAGDGARGPTLTADVHAFELAPGSPVTRHHVLVMFRFLEVDQLQLDGFNHQNALYGLSINDISDRQLERARFEVRFQASAGLGASFRCYDAEIVAVRPWSRDAPVDG